jgi:hypothetical protein
MKIVCFASYILSRQDEGIKSIRDFAKLIALGSMPTLFLILHCRF